VVLPAGVEDRVAVGAVADVVAAAVVVVVVGIDSEPRTTISLNPIFHVVTEVESTVKRKEVV
jgi:hypothetical protein